MVVSMNTEDFERAYVAICAERVDALNMSHSEFGRQVFGETSGVRLWRLCRADKRTRSVTLAESMRMAEVLGQDFAAFIWQVRQEASARGLI